MKKILITVFLIIWTVSITNANSVDFYWEKDNSRSEISSLEEGIKQLQDNTGLNTDIVILWKNDKEWCYNISNFENCVQTKYWYG